MALIIPPPPCTLCRERVRLGQISQDEIGDGVVKLQAQDGDIIYVCEGCLPKYCVVADDGLN
jgi:hypothetical protein